LTQIIVFLVVLLLVATIISYIFGSLLDLLPGLLLLLGVVGLTSGFAITSRCFVILLRDVHQKKIPSSSSRLATMLQSKILPQPGELIYPFGYGWQTFSTIRSNLFLKLSPMLRWWFDFAAPLHLNAQYGNRFFLKLIFWVGTISLWLIGLAHWAGAYLLASFLLALNALFLAIWLSTAFAAIGGYDLLQKICRRAFPRLYRCPDCRTSYISQVYICPSCGDEHSRLQPSGYGIFYHRCTCGNRLPALALLGRRNLERRCPVCKISTRPGTSTPVGQLYIPVIGGPQSGKTSFIVQATRQFMDIYAPSHRLSAAFVEDDDQERFSSDVDLLCRGKVVPTTSYSIPRSIPIRVIHKKMRTFPVICLYDAAGGAYSMGSNSLMQKPYFERIDGLILIIDPFSIPYFARQHEGQIAAKRKLLNPSCLPPDEVYARLIMLMEACKEEQPTRYRQPLAVVITKTDALNLEGVIGHVAAHRLIESFPKLKTEANAIHELVRTFLESNQQSRLVRDLELQFETVRYFTCSALGRMPSNEDSSAFIPQRALDPLLWILKKTALIN